MQKPSYLEDTVSIAVQVKGLEALACLLLSDIGQEMNVIDRKDLMPLAKNLITFQDKLREAREILSPFIDKQ